MSSYVSLLLHCILCLFITTVLFSHQTLALPRKLAGKGESKSGLHPKHSSTAPSAITNNFPDHNSPTSTGSQITYEALRRSRGCSNQRYQSCMMSPQNPSNRKKSSNIRN